MNDHTQHELDTQSLVNELNSLATLGFIAVDNEIFGTELERQHLMATLLNFLNCWSCKRNLQV